MAEDMATLALLFALTDPVSKKRCNRLSANLCFLLGVNSWTFNLTTANPHHRLAIRHHMEDSYSYHASCRVNPIQSNQLSSAQLNSNSNSSGLAAVT